MTLICVGEVTSRIKGIMFIIINIKLVKLYYCEKELTNKHSQNLTAVISKHRKVIGHVPEALASKLLTLMQE